MQITEKRCLTGIKPVNYNTELFWLCLKNSLNDCNGTKLELLEGWGSSVGSVWIFSGT